MKPAPHRKQESFQRNSLLLLKEKPILAFLKQYFVHHGLLMSDNPLSIDMLHCLNSAVVDFRYKEPVL